MFFLHPSRFALANLAGRRGRGWVFLFLCLLHPAWAAPADTFTVTGAVARPGAWDKSRLDRERPGAWHTVPYTLKGERHTARAVLLLDVLNAAGVRADPHAKNARLRMTVLVTGRDGYTAAFSLAEMLPDFGGRPAWLAFTVDGKPLPDGDAPTSLLVPADKKAGRWVHGIASVTVLDAP